MNKAELRAFAKVQNSALSETERQLIDERILNNLFSCEISKYRNVFIYISFGREIETSEIIKRLISAGAKICVPICRRAGEMEAKRISSVEELSPGMYGIYEPPESAQTVEPSELDLIIVPGLAFGEDFTRLGRGAGYYDRFLDKAKNSKVIALCREQNLFKTVPCEEHDRTVDVIVTEKRIIKK